jgi:hypothetical protein
MVKCDRHMCSLTPWARAAAGLWTSTVAVPTSVMLGRDAGPRVPGGVSQTSGTREIAFKRGPSVARDEIAAIVGSWSSAALTIDCCLSRRGGHDNSPPAGRRIASEVHGGRHTPRMVQHEL